MTILYIGNKLYGQGRTPTGVDILGAKIAQTHRVVAVSDKRNSLSRLVDMLVTVIKERKRTDYVLIDTYSTLAYYYACLVASLCRFYKMPYIPILHGGNLPERLARSRKQCEKLFAGSYLNVAPSSYMWETFVKRGFANTTMIPNGIEVEKIPFLERLAFNPPALLWVRSFDRTYNCLMAPQVLALLKKKYPLARLCMVGPDKDGSLQEVIDQCRLLGLSVSIGFDLVEECNRSKADVVFTGIITPEQWYLLSQSFNFFINTTHVDNTPVSVMEAMALGLPVVSTNVGGIPFLIEDGQDGLTVPDGDVQQMAQRIDMLVNQPSMAHSIAHRAREKVHAFDWSNVLDKWNNLLTK